MNLVPIAFRPLFKINLYYGVIVVVGVVAVSFVAIFHHRTRNTFSIGKLDDFREAV